MPTHPNLRADQTEGNDGMNTPSARSIYVARSLPAAIDALDEYGSAGAPFAGGTWIMRSPIRHEPHQPHYVAIGKIAELTAIRIEADIVEIGAAVTHAALASALADLPEFNVLATAAGRSANPAIRAMATIGGNLSTSGFRRSRLRARVALPRCRSRGLQPRRSGVDRPGTLPQDQTDTRAWPDCSLGSSCLGGVARPPMRACRFESPAIIRLQSSASQ